MPKKDKTPTRATKPVNPVPVVPSPTRQPRRGASLDEKVQIADHFKTLNVSDLTRSELTDIATSLLGRPVSDSVIDGVIRSWKLPEPKRLRARKGLGKSGYPKLLIVANALEQLYSLFNALGDMGDEKVTAPDDLLKLIRDLQAIERAKEQEQAGNNGQGGHSRLGD